MKLLIALSFCVLASAAMAQTPPPRDQAATFLLNQASAREMELAAAAFGLQKQLQDVTKERDELKAKLAAQPPDAK